MKSVLHAVGLCLLMIALVKAINPDIAIIDVVAIAIGSALICDK